MSYRNVRIIAVGAIALCASAAFVSAASAASTTTKPKAGAASSAGMAPIPLKLPKPAFLGTPKQIPPGLKNLEMPSARPRPAFYAPIGVTNVALHKPVTGSDNNPITGTLSLVTDGDKGATEGSWVEMGPGTQWAQIDLQKTYKIYAIVVWHYHAEARVYRDVVVQVADDPDFITNVRTLFNNDSDNEIGLGLGKDKQYFESYEGKLIHGNGDVARYVRLYSHGNTADDQNHYTEVEVYGLPAK